MLKILNKYLFTLKTKMTTKYPLMPDWSKLIGIGMDQSPRISVGLETRDAATVENF